MSFASPEYIILFCISVPLFFMLPQRFRWVVLLIASYVFYGAFRADYLIIIVGSTLVDFYAAKWIDETPIENSRRRKMLLTVSMTMNLGVLFTFKYFNFFSESFEILFTTFGIPYQPILHELILPVGISFYTFQSMAYTIDVYRRVLPAEKNLGVFATFIAFFPQLVAGPIERAPNLLPQFHLEHRFEYDRVVAGLRLVLWGAFKKIVIANRLAIFVNAIYNDVESYNGLILIVATIFFAIQIYCDFSGYSDMAIGSAKVMGFDLMQNFRQPYFSQSVREFWRRWHISLSTWFRDYLYIPLGGNRISYQRTLLNLFIVFLVSGLWHGANWTFVMWGALHGIYIVIETIWSNWSARPKLPAHRLSTILRMGFTFILVVIAWVFFRANTIQDAWYILTHAFNFQINLLEFVLPYDNLRMYRKYEFAISIGLIVLLFVIEWLSIYWQLPEKLSRFRTIRWGLYYLAAFILLASVLDISAFEQPFIYFQF